MGNVNEAGLCAGEHPPIFDPQISNQKLLVTGATGNVGREVVAALRELGQPAVGR